MPQPYRGSVQPAIYPEAVLDLPHLGRYVGGIAAAFEHVEDNWGVMLAIAVRSNANVVVEMYLKIIGAAARAGLLKEGFREALKGAPDLLERVNTEIGSYRKCADARNTIVHGLWGHIPGRDDILVMAERGWMSRNHAHVNEMWVEAQARGETPSFAPKVKTYNEKDFTDILGRINGLAGMQHALIYAIDRRLAGHG